MFAVLVVEIGAEEIASVVRKNRIDADCVRPTSFVDAAQMPVYLRVSKRHEVAVGAVRAPLLRLAAESRPLV